MMEPTRNIRSNNQAADGFDRDLNDPLFKSSRYMHPRVAAKSGYPLEENLPIFLSASEEDGHAAELQDNSIYDDREQDSWSSETALEQGALQQRAFQQSDWQHSGYEQDPWEQETWETQRRKGLTARRIVKFSLVAAAMAGSVFAAFNLQGRHGLIADASASLAAVLPALPGAKRPVPQPATQAAAEPAQMPPSPASAPSREVIASAFQTALQTQPVIQQPQPVVQPPAIVQQPAVEPPAPAARSIDPAELAALLKRAQSMMDIGDIASARLLLERAAGAHEAKAALLLAQSYDPAVLGTTDLRTITADPATARLWYQKAAEFGSQEARNRLAQMTN